MDSSPNLTLPYIAAAQAQKHVTHNEAIRALDALVQLMVLDKDLASPPGSPADGSRYIVAASPTGAWAGQAGKVAAYQDGAWAFFTPREGWLAWVADDDKIYFHDGSAWAEVTVGVGSGASSWGINATADTANRLALKSAASLFDNVGGGHQQKINKAAAGDTASTLYQTGYSGRAEFGLTGDDDFHVKVSPNGSTWNEAIVVDRSTGAARFPSTAYLDLPAGSAPATPASGKVRLYAKTDKSLYRKDDAGLETGLAGGGSSMLVAPQGRLTLTSATPVLTADVLAATTIYFTPYVGAAAPFWDGTIWTLVSLSEFSLALDSNSGHAGYHQSGKNFDLFLDYNGGAPRLVSGPAWTNDTTRASAISRQNGIWLNTSSMTARFGVNSGDTATIAASRATWIGTFRASANGQTEMKFGGAGSGGTAASLLLWNAYNRRMISTFTRDTTSSWTYSTTTIRALNASNGNRASFVCGLDEEAVRVDLAVNIGAPASPSGAAGYVALGLDSTTAAATEAWFAGHGIASALLVCISSYVGRPGQGFHFVQALDDVTGSTFTFYGNTNMSMVGTFAA